MFGLGTREVVIIAVVAVLLFGSRSIPALTKSVVEAIRTLRGAFKDDEVIASAAVSKKVTK